jgi:putative FmdB family regulatory protein
MPTYEYICSNCEHHFEKFQSITAPASRKCPKCGKSSLKRLIGTGAAIIFKGSGFYQTDYRSDSYTQSAKKETPKKEEKTETKTETKSEAKSETKTETKSETKKAPEPKTEKKEKKK